MNGGYNYMFNVPQGPEVYTPKEKIEGLLAQLIGQVVPGASALVPMVMPYIWKLTGLENDFTFDAPIITEATPYGAAMYDKFQKSFSSGGYATSQLDDATKFKVAKTFAKLLNSEKAFSDMQKEGQYTGMSYEEFLQMKAADYSDNFITEQLYNFADPLNTKITNKYLSMAGSNLARRQLAHGGIEDSYTRRNAFANAARVMTGIFTNEKGEYDYKDYEYGGFRAQESAAIAAAVSRDTDFLGDADITKTSSIENAATKFRKSVQDYAKALAPLKDVFGKDMDNLLRTIEELAGMSITAMGPERAGKIARDISNKISLGRYGMEQVSATANLMSQELASMDTPTMNRLQGVNYATAALDMAKGGFVSNAFTAREMAGFAAQRVLDTGTSRGAEAFDLGYSLWKKRAIDHINTADISKIDKKYWAARTGLKNITDDNIQDARKKMIATLDSDRYMELIQQRTARGMTAMEANYDLAGVTNQHQLQAGYNYGYYREAKENNLGLYSSLEERHRMEQDVAGLRIMEDNTIGGESGGQRGAVYSKLMTETLQGANMELLNMGDAERIAKLGELGYNKDEAEIANAIMSRMSYQGEYSELYQSKVNIENLRMQREATVKAAQRREAMDTFLHGKKNIKYGDFKEFTVTAIDKWLNDNETREDKEGNVIAHGGTFISAVEEDLKTKVMTLAQDPAEQKEYQAVFDMAQKAARRQLDTGTAFSIEKQKELIQSDAANFGKMSESAKKWAKENKKTYDDKKGLSDADYTTYVQQMAEKAVQRNKKEYIDTIKSYVGYAMSADGLANPYAREAITRRMKLDTLPTKDDKDNPVTVAATVAKMSSEVGITTKDMMEFVTSAGIEITENEKKVDEAFTKDAQGNVKVNLKQASTVLDLAKDMQAAKLAVATEIDPKTLDKYIRDNVNPNESKRDASARILNRLAAIAHGGSAAIGNGKIKGTEAVLRTLQFENTSKILSKKDSSISKEQQAIRDKGLAAWTAFNKTYEGTGENWQVDWANWIVSDAGLAALGYEELEQAAKEPAEDFAARKAKHRKTFIENTPISKISDVVKQSASLGSQGVFANQGGASDLLGAITSFFTTGMGKTIVDQFTKGSSDIKEGGEAIRSGSSKDANPPPKTPPAE